MFNPENDLTAIQNFLIQDPKIINIMGLSGKTHVEISKRIIKRSKWDDLVDGEKRLCIYSIPSRSTRIEVLFEEMIEIDCHVPAGEDYKARQIIGRVVDIVNNARIGGRYLKSKGYLGELSTMSKYYCCGNRFGYYSPI